MNVCIYESNLAAAFIKRCLKSVVCEFVDARFTFVMIACFYVSVFFTSYVMKRGYVVCPTPEAGLIKPKRREFAEFIIYTTGCCR